MPGSRSTPPPGRGPRPPAGARAALPPGARLPRHQRVARGRGHLRPGAHQQAPPLGLHAAPAGDAGGVLLAFARAPAPGSDREGGAERLATPRALLGRGDTGDRSAAGAAALGAAAGLTRFPLPRATQRVPLPPDVGAWPARWHQLIEPGHGPLRAPLHREAHHATGVWGRCAGLSRTLTAPTRCVARTRIAGVADVLPLKHVAFQI
jgi:hypothetical protein